MKINKLIIGTVAGAGMLLATMTPAFAANTTVVVRQSDLDNTSSNPAVVATDGLNKWFMYNDTNDTIDNTLGSFVSGPGTSPNGSGSIQFTLGASPLDRKNIATYQFSGDALSSFTTMSYTAYSHSGVAGPTESPFFNFNVDLSGTSSAFQGRLVYVPSANGSVPQDTWNNFDMINGGNAMWTWSPFASNGDKWPDGNTNEYRTWSDIMATWPNARILPVGGWLGIRVGEPGPTGYTGNVASVTLGTASDTTTYDFEPLPNVNVTIVKYLNGSPATAVSANNTSFPMTATWNAANIGAGTGTYTLGPTGFNNPNPYQATTSDMTQGASYTTSEVTNNIDSSSNVLPVGATCQTGKTRLVGYSFGNSLSDAENAGTSSTAPNFTNLTTNKFVIVRNESCTNPPTTFAQCNGNGWKTFNNPPFKNVGLCVAYVAKHQHNVDGSITYTASFVRHAILAMNSAINSGVFFYWDANHDWYSVNVSDVNVSGDTAWFAGKVTNASQHAWVGQWLFAKVTDNSPDMIWGSFTDQTTALNGVNSMTDPADGPFTVTSGNVTVH